MECVFRREKDDVRLSIYFDESPESPREWDNLGTMVCAHRRYSLGDEQAQNLDDYDSWFGWFHGEVIEPNGGDSNVVWLPLFMLDHSGISIRTSSFNDPWDSGQVGYIYATKDKLRKETGYNEAELFSKEKHRLPQVGEHVKVKGYLLHGRYGWGKVIGEAEGRFLVDFDYDKIPSYRKLENVVSASLDEIAEVMSNRAEEMLNGEVEIYDDYVQGNVYGFVLERKVVCACCGSVEYEDIDSCWGFYGDYARADMKEQVSEEYRNWFEED